MDVSKRSKESVGIGTEILCDVIVLVLMSLVVSAAIFFVATVLLTFDFTFRAVFWPVFIVLGNVGLFYLVFISRWLKSYHDHCRAGYSEGVAFDKACTAVKFRLPRFCLQIFRVNCR